MRVLATITAPLRYLLEETIAGKALLRVSEKTGERALFSPGAYQEMYGGYTSTGVPWLDVGADIVGDLTGSLAQIYMANQLLGPALAAAGKVPQVAKAGQAAGEAISKLPTLAQKIAVRAPRAALTGATVETMRQAMYPDEYKPGAAGIARGALMWTGGSIGNTLVEAAMQKAGIVLHPALEAFVEEIGENVGSTIAVAPFVEDKQQLLMELGPDILAEGLYEAVGRLIAGSPVDYESARIYVEMKQDLQEYTANKNVNPEKADAAYKRFWKRINDVFSDEIVGELQNLGYHFEDANDLYEALQAEARTSRELVDPELDRRMEELRQQREEIESWLAEIKQRAEGVSEVWIWPKETEQAQQMVAQAVPQGEAAAELEKRAKTIDFSLEESDDLTLIVVPNAEGQSEIVGAWWKSPIEGVKMFVPNIPEPTDEVRAMLRSQPSYYAAHFAVVRDLFGEPIVRQWRVANAQYERFVKEYERILYDIFKPFAKNPQERERITLMLEGKLPLKGREGVAAMRLRKEFYGENPESGLFKQFRINPNQFHHEYSPRIRQAGDIEFAFAGGLPQEYEFFARMHRSGELDPRETDALNIALAYLRQGAKEKFYNPVIESVKPLVDEMHPDRRFIYEQWVNTILGRPALQERLANEAIRKVANLVLKPFGRELKGRPAQAASSFLADLSYQGTMGWTLSAPLKNLTQQALTIGYLDKKPGQGLEYWAKARVAKHTKTGKELLKYCWVVQDRQYLEGLDAQYQFMQKVMGTSRKYGFFLFRQADIDNVTNAYLGGTLQALDEGKSLAEAVEYGNQVAASTQFLMGLDSPMLFKSPLGRMVGIYASWPVNFMRLLWEQGSSAQKHRIASTIVSMIGVAYLMEKLTGLSFKSTRPEEVVKDFLPVKLITGETSSPPVNAAASAIRWLLGAASNADPEFIEAAKNEFIKNMKSFIPGHNAYAAAVRFIEDAVNDWKRYDERGRLMYEITPGEAIRDLIGTTVESEQRQKQHQEIERTKKRYSELRAKAIDAYLDGDIETYREAQAQLRQEFRTMVTLADIQRERQLRQQTSLERHATGLPQTIRQMMGLDTAGIGSAGGLGSFRLGSAMPRSRLSSLGFRSAMPRSRLVTQTRGTSSASGLGSFRLGSVMPRSRLVTQTRLSSMMGR